MGLVLVYGAARGLSEYAREAGVEAMRGAQATSPADSTIPFTALSTDRIDQSLWAPERVRAFARSIAIPAAPAGLLHIPSVRLQVPVYPGTSELNLNRGAGHIEGTAALLPNGNVGIAGHRDGFFRRLKDVGLGDEIHLQAAAGSMRYRVAEISIVEPEDTSPLAQGGAPSLTLVTCYPFYFVGTAPQRYIVRAELVDVQLPAEDRPIPVSKEVMP